MASLAYNIALEKADTAGLGLVANRVDAMCIVGTATTPDNPDHDFVADIVADEATDASYARVILTTKVGTRNDTLDRHELDFDNIDYGALTGETVTAIVLFRFVTNDADSFLLSYHDISDTITDGTGFVVVVGSTGGIHITSV